MTNTEDYSMAFSLFSDEQLTELPLVFQIHGEDFPAIVEYFRENIENLPPMLGEFDKAEAKFLEELLNLQNQIRAFSGRVRRMANPLVPLMLRLRGMHPIAEAREAQILVRGSFDDILKTSNFIRSLIALLNPLTKELKAGFDPHGEVYRILDNLEVNFNEASRIHAERYILIQDNQAQVKALEKQIYWLMNFESK